MYNNTDGVLDISGDTLWALTGAGAQAIRFTVPGAVGSATTVIPARGHYLIVNSSAYTLGAAAAGDGTYTTGIVDGSGIGFFTGATPTIATRIDSVGFDTRDPLFFEGTALAPSSATGTGGITTGGEYAFLRKLTTGTPQDTDNNANDFTFVSVTAGSFTSIQSTLGAPGPENLASPIQRNGTIKSSLIDPAQPSGVAPNRVRDTTPNGCNGGVGPSNCTLGTLTIRRKFTNTTGVPITRLRFRVVDVTTAPPPNASTADLRALTSATATVTITGGGSVIVQGLTLETPPAQPNGGGINSTLASGTVTAGTPLANGASVNVQFLLGVQQGGSYRFFINVEALP